QVVPASSGDLGRYLEATLTLPRGWRGGRPVIRLPCVAMNTQHDLAASRTTGEWQDADSRHYLHPFTDFKQLAAHGARIITSASGVYLTDSDGKRILDAMAGLWCVNVGYGRRELAEVAYQQMLELPYYNSFFKSAHPPAIELAALLAEAPPPQFSR